MKTYKNKWAFTGMAALLLAFGLVLAGCEDVELENIMTEKNAGDAKSEDKPGSGYGDGGGSGVLTSISKIDTYLSRVDGGGTDDDPILLPLKLNITNDWNALIQLINYYGKKVSLDLSDCTMNGKEFDPGTANTGEEHIVSLVLPDAAEIVKGEELSFHSTFRNFTALKSVSGENVRTIGWMAFTDRTSLTTVNFPHVTDIDYMAFAGCTNLTSMDIPASLTLIEVQAFSGCTSLSKFTVSPYSNKYKASYDKKMLLSKNGKTLIAYPTASGKLTLDDPKITAIGGSAFSGCELITLELPYVTEYIGNYALAGSSLIVFIAPKVKSIGEYVFDGARNLMRVDLDEVTYIGQGAFRDCTMLVVVGCPKIEHIESYAFAGTGSGMLYLGFGNKAPTLGTAIFLGVESTKQVRLYAYPSYSGYGPIPSTYTGTIPDANPATPGSYADDNGKTENWGNGFRGMGWTGSKFYTDSYTNSRALNSNIELNIAPLYLDY